MWKLLSSRIPMLWVFTVLFFTYQLGIRASIPNVLNENLRSNFGIGSKELGLLIDCGYITYMLMQIPIGVIIDRFSLKKIVLSSFFLTAASLITFVYTQNFIVAMISQLILGMAAASGFAMIFKISNICFAKDKMAIITSIAMSISSFGIVAFEMMTAYLSKIFVWREVVIWIGIVGVVLCLILQLFVDDIPNDTENMPSESQGDMFHTAKIIFGERRFLLIGLFSMMIYGTGSTFAEVWGVSFIKNIHNLDIVTATSIVSMHFMGIVAGGPFLAYISGLIKSYTKMMIVGSSLLFGAALIITFATDINIHLLYIVVFLLGMGASSNTFSFLEAMSLLPKEIGGSVTGTLNTMTMLGSTLMIPTVGLVLDVSKGSQPAYSSTDYHHGLLVLVISSFLSVITALCVRKKLK